MALKNPKDLLKVFESALAEIRGRGPLNPADRQRIVADLADVFNYVAATSQEPSPTNTIYAVAAHDARMAELSRQECETLRQHREFIEKSFDKSEQYLKAIQLGGYAAFFALWSITKEWLCPVWGLLAALLMIVSGSVFVIWELYKGTLLTGMLRSHASFVKGKLEDFIKLRMPELLDENKRILSLTESRATVWRVSVWPAVAAVSIMLWQLLGVISAGFLG